MHYGFSGGSIVAILMTIAAAMMISTPAAAQMKSQSQAISQSRTTEGFRISPIPRSKLNLKGKDVGMVGMGSYLVNGVGDCSGCHSYPRFLVKGDAAGSNPNADDPYNGVPADQSNSAVLAANYNIKHFLAGGQCFGPFMARNLTPDPANGRPEDLTQAEFIKVMRTGEDVTCENNPGDPICAIEPPVPVLQVMPWATYHNMTDADLKAIYAYLSALPALDPCNTPADGCPGFSGAAANSTSYHYSSTDDCPNPAPPQ